MKKQKVLIILIVIISILIVLAVGITLYLINKRNTTPIISRASSSYISFESSESISSSSKTSVSSISSEESSSAETIPTRTLNSFSFFRDDMNYNYVNIVDYKDKVKIKDYEGFTLYYTNLVKPVPDPNNNPSVAFDLLLQKSNSEVAILLTGINADAFEYVTSEYEKAALATRIVELSDNGKYITFGLQRITSVESSGVVLCSLETGKYITYINNYVINFPNNGSNPGYIIFRDYVVSQTFDENATWDTGYESGTPFKLILTNLINKSSQNLIIPDPYSDIVLKSVSSDGILTYDLQKSLTSDNYKRNFKTETKTLNLNPYLNK